MPYPPCLFQGMKRGGERKEEEGSEWTEGKINGGHGIKREEHGKSKDRERKENKGKKERRNGGKNKGGKGRPRE